MNLMPPTPLDPQFVRKLCLLCCHCARNIAYYRVGFANENGAGGLKEPTQFGATVNSNMLDIAVLEWCKLFADHKARHHWKRFIRSEDDQKRFLGELLGTTGLSLNEWKRYLDEMRVYRDKFVAHLDEQNVMRIPSLGTALESVFFLYADVRLSSPAEIFATSHLANLPDDLSDYYNACRDEGRAAYAVGRNP
ncbi:hypothetical protein PQR72_30815 [Paraburkholderia madseniana]|uniref:hypothetical protein n=1 Tax=Paraburkholderia madseniana TaxID=2599607 RepID=UPI0015C54C3D|nr:hypothetical protein [Paraburkholderia madseniana]NPT68596.1 hypothetical protein [Paraburkholderia madseniana]